MLGSIARDIRMAIRLLAKAPGFTGVSLLTLTVAIGAITAIFSVVDAVLLQPLAYPDADELVTVAVDASGANVPELPFSDRGYWHFHDKNRSFDGVGGFGQAVVALTEAGEPTELSIGLMTRSAFDHLDDLAQVTVAKTHRERLLHGQVGRGRDVLGGFQALRLHSNDVPDLMAHAHIGRSLVKSVSAIDAVKETCNADVRFVPPFHQQIVRTLQVIEERAPRMGSDVRVELLEQRHVTRVHIFSMLTTILPSLFRGSRLEQRNTAK